MNDKEPLLKVRIEGDAVGSGKISVSHLLRFLANFNKAMQRTGHVLIDDIKSIHRGRKPRNVTEEVALDLVLMTQGSPATVLGFERRKAEQSFPEMDLGLEIIEKTLTGLERIQEEGDDLPEGYDAGVLLAWRDVGLLFRQGIHSIRFTFKHPQKPVDTQFTLNGFERIQKRIQGPQSNIRTIEGRLLMADFKEHGTRCRVHPSVGDPILCLFDEEQKDEVLENILQYVRVVGEAREDLIAGKIVDIKIHDIERLEDKENEATDLLPKGTPLSRNFWDSPTLDELAMAQSVQPLADARALFGTWPGFENDGFEEGIDELRRLSVAGEFPL